MLIINSSGQVAIPIHNVCSVVVQPSSVDLNAFYDNDGGHETDLRDKPTNIIVTGMGVNFTEQYGSAEKAQAQMARLKMAYQCNSRTFTFEYDKEYAEQRKEMALKKARERQLEKPAYAQGEEDGKEG